VAFTENKLNIRLVGFFETVFNDTKVVIDSKAAREVLVYLALKSNSSRVNRKHLACMIWPDMDEDRARTNLRQSLHNLKTSLAKTPFEGLMIDRQSVYLQTDSYVTDIHILKKSLQQGDPIPDILIEGEPIAEKVLADFKANNLFEDWVSLRRTEIQQDLQSLLRKNLTRYTESGLLKTTCKALLVQDSGDELACRTMMTLHRDAGQSAEALRYYKLLWKYLSDEFDLEPSEKTKELALSIKLGDQALEPDSLEPAKSEFEKLPDDVNSTGDNRPTIQVGPFDLELVESHMQPILRGFRSELMSRLAKFREWRVLDGEHATEDNIVTDYRLPVVAIQQSEKTKISISLIRETSKEIVWSETYDSLSSQWLQILTETITEISGSTNINISRSRLLESAGQEVSSVNGFDAWLIGQRLLFTCRQNNWQSAVQLFKRLTEQEPNFTRAYTSLAQASNIKHLAFPGISPDTQVLTEALHTANKAISIDPLDSQAHLCKAWSNVMLGNFQLGEYEFKTARNLNSYDPWTTLSSALGESFCGNYELANNLASRSLKMGWTIEPSHWVYHATIRYLIGDDEGCLDACLNADNVFYNIAAWRAASMVRLNNLSAAKEVFKNYVGVCSENWCGSGPCTADAVLEWTLSSFPIKDIAVKNRFRNALISCAE